MKERKRYKVIDKHSGPIPLFTREYTIDDFPFLGERFSLSYLFDKKYDIIPRYNYAMENIMEFLLK